MLQKRDRPHAALGVVGQADELASVGFADEVCYAVQNGMVMLRAADLHETHFAAKVIDHLLIILDGPLLEGEVALHAGVHQPVFTRQSKVRERARLLLVLGEIDVRAAPRKLPMPRRIILKCHLSPGDLCTLTAAIHSLHDACPGHYLTDVRTSCDELFLHNPRITRLAEGRAESIELHYDLIHRCDSAPIPFLRGYCDDLGRRLGIALELSTNRPHIYLAEDEKQARPFADLGLPGEYWLVNAGVKSDFTLKQWPVEYYQEVVDHFRGKVSFVQVG